MFEYLRNYLISGGIATVYIDYFPATPDHAICIRRFGANPPDLKYSYDTIGLQILARSLTHSGAMNLANTAFNRLHGNNYSEGIGYDITDIRAQQSPYFIGLDDAKRYTFTQNMIIEYFRNAQ